MAPRNGHGPDDNDGFNPFEGMPNLTGYKRPNSDGTPAIDERQVIHPALWHGEPIPPMEWVVDGLIPSRVVTMLSGDGGLGKSLLALQLAVACATDELWLGRKVKMVKVLVVACEDEPAEIHRRLYNILVNMHLEFDALLDLRIIPGAGEDNVLVDFKDFGDHGKRTAFCDFVLRHATNFGAQLVVLDSLHDFYAANENDRAMVRLFVSHLRKIAMEIDGSILLLAHPSVSGQSDGSGRSGSTAWNNAVRSRLYLVKPQDPSAKHLELKTLKANYGPSGGVIRLEYRGSMIHPLDDPEKVDDPVYVQVQVDDVFLTCLRAAAAQGRRVTDTKYGNYAPKVFATMKAINRSYGMEEFARAMARLFDDGKIKNGEVIDAQRKRQQGIIEVMSTNLSSQLDDF